MGGCGRMGMAAQHSDLSNLFHTVMYALGNLASQMLAILTSGPVLAFLLALLMLLLVVALIKFILFGEARTRTIHPPSQRDIRP
jgi:hypothetical protein